MPRTIPTPPKINFAQVFARNSVSAEAKRTLAGYVTERDKSQNLLKPSDIGGGQMDFARGLVTSMGVAAGTRPITLADLRKFDRYARALGKKYIKGGITAQQVIEFSNKVGLTQKPSKQTDCEAPDVGSPTARNA